MVDAELNLVTEKEKVDFYQRTGSPIFVQRFDPGIKSDQATGYT
jgi:hypothetical protein